MTCSAFAPAAMRHRRARGASEALSNSYRAAVALPRRGFAALVDRSVAHDDDPVSRGHRFDLVVGYVDRRCLQTLMQLLDRDAQLHSHLDVEVGQRLVEEKDARVTNDRTCQRLTLSLAAGKLPRITPEQRLEPEDVGSTADARRIWSFAARLSRSENPMFCATRMCG